MLVNLNLFKLGGGLYMKVIAILLVILGVLGLLMSALMYGDIGIAAGIGALTALLSGFGFLNLNKKLSN